MKTTEYNNLKQQVQDKYDNSLKLAEKQRKEALDAIEKVWSMLSKEKQSDIDESEQKPLKTTNGYGSLTSAIKKSLELVPKRFTKKDIRLVLPRVSKEIANSCKDASLTGCLKRLERQGIIDLVKRGKGSIATTYKRLK